jgi:hypothetical protein
MEQMDLMIKHLAGEELSADEQEFMRKRSAKYELVRFLYMEKNPHIINFQFSPGASFMDTPTIDIVNTLSKFTIIDENIDLRQWDGTCGNPPKTNIEKRDLREVYDRNVLE